jgi:hypothetical protein
MPHTTGDNTELILKSSIALLALLIVYMIIRGGMF